MHAQRVVVIGLLATLAPAPRARAEAAPSTVALDVRSVDEQTYRKLDLLGLEKQTVLRLVQEGFAVIAPSARPEVMVRYLPTARGLVIVAESHGERRSRDVVFSDQRLAELHLELAQKTVELVRESLGIAPPADKMPAPSPSPQPAAAPPPATAAPPPPTVVKRSWARPISFDLSVGANVLLRQDTADLLVSLGGRLGIGRGLGLLLHTAFFPSIGGPLRVLEWQLQLGAGYRFELGRRFELDLAALVGLLLHYYSLDDPRALDRTGTHLDFLASLPLAFTVRVWRGLGFTLRFAPGLSHRDRTHVRDGQILWSRSAYRFELGLAIRWHW